MSQILANINASGGFITGVTGGNNITVTTLAGVATVNVSGTTNHAVQVGSAAGALTSLALGTVGQVLTSNGAGVNPSFQTLPGVINLTYTNVNTSPYVVLSTDEYLSVDCSGGAITLQFPNAAKSGRAWIVKDRTGSAATHNITLTTVGGAVNIDGATTYVFNNNYQSVQIIGTASTYELY